MTKPTILAIAAACALQGCIQYSDTVNRAQFSSFAAAGGQSADTPMFADTTAGNTYPAAENTAPQTAGKKAAKKKTAVQSGGKYHPNIVAFFRRSCESSYKYLLEEDPGRGLDLNDCRYSDADIQQNFQDHIVYRDKDVAVVIAPRYMGEYGNSGYVPFELLDLHAPAGSDGLFWCEGYGVKASRKGSRITMKFTYGKSKTETFDLKKKGKTAKECKALRG